jgi:hypothetical protein
VTRLLALVWPALRREPADPAALATWEPMLDALDDLSPRVEAVDPGVALVDISGLGILHGSEPRIAERAAELVRGVAPLELRCGIGDNRWLAVLAARLASPAEPGEPVAVRRIPRGRRAARMLAPLPVELLPLDPATRARLALFGIARMGQLAALPRSAVGAQFGAVGERLSALARGEDPRPLAPRRRPERLVAETAFEPPLDGIGSAALLLRRACAELCERLAARDLAPGRARLAFRFEAARPLEVELVFPEPALEPDWIARLLAGRVEEAARGRRACIGEATPDGEEGEPRVVGLRLVLDRLAVPSSRQLAAFEARVGRWEELRWALERIRSRFGEGRLWRAVCERPTAALAEQRSRLADIGFEAPAS